MEKIDGLPLSKTPVPETLAASGDRELTFSARVDRIQNMGGVSLIFLRAGRYVFQAEYSAKKCIGDFNALKEGARVKISGVVKKEARARLGYEIKLSRFEIISVPINTPAIGVNEALSVEAGMEDRFSALNHPSMRAAFKITDEMISAFCSFMRENGFTQITSPTIVSAGAEDNKNAFRLKYFGENAVLKKDSLMYRRAMAAAFDRVFEISHAHRADRHNSLRHLNEFHTLCFEVSYINGLRDIIQTETALIKYIAERIKNRCGYELELLGAILPEVKSIPCITFYEAMDILGKPHTQPDLDPTDENKLCLWAAEGYGSDYVFVERLPAKKQNICCGNCADDPRLSESFVLLLRGMEISAGGVRIHDYDEQYEKLIKRGLAAKKQYLDILLGGMPPHGGAAMGLERLVMKLLGLNNIRQASLFPRDLHHLYP